MAYQDDFRNKVLAALKAKNLAVDISQEATQQAIVQEVQNVAKSEAMTMSAAEMKSVLEDVAREMAAENKQVFSAQSADFTAFKDQLAGGGPTGPGGSYSGGGIAASTANKDIMIIPANGGLGAAGSATSVNSLSQIDFKHIANPLAYGVFDPNEVKASLFNWAERISGNLFDTPVLGLGGAWGGVSYAPTAQWGIGGSQGSGVGGSINTDSGFGQIIYFKPATSTIYAALYNDVAIDTSVSNGRLTLIGYSPAVPGTFPTAGFAVTFGGIGGSGDLVIQGAPLSTQTNTVKFQSPLTILNTTTTDTLTLGLSSATSTVQNFVGGGSAQYQLSTTTSSFTAGDIFYSSGSGHVTLTPLNKGANNSYLSVNGSGNYTWTTSISASTANVAAASGSTVLYPILNNSTQSGVALSYDVDFNLNPFNNILQYASGSIWAGTAMSAPIFTTNGDLSIRPGANSTTAIQLDNASGSPVLNVDTTNSRIGINNVTAPLFSLDVSGDVNVSTGSSYRINNVPVLFGTTLGSTIVTSSLTSVGTLTGGTWNATTIAADRGGTGQNTYSVGDILYGTAANTLSKLAAVTAGQFLVSNGTGAAPQYVAATGVSVGFATISATQYVAANTTNADNYITFTNATSTASPGVGLSISNTSSQLTYNPGSQQLKVANITGTAFTATNLTGTLLTAAQNNITSASSLVTVGTITSGTWSASTIAVDRGGTGQVTYAVGDILYASASTTLTKLSTPAAGAILYSNGVTTAPSWATTLAGSYTFTGGPSFTTIAPTSTVIPTSANDLVNKTYVDSISGGLDPHASVRLTTISAIGGSYRQLSGLAGTTWGQGDYIIATTPAELIGVAVGLDTPNSGIALTNGQRVLVKDGVLGGYASASSGYSLFSSLTTFGGIAASYVANGIYTVASYGGAATSGWLLVRATDTDNQSGVQELTGGTFTFVEEGTNYADNAFVCTNDTTSLGAIGFGATQITWSPFSGGASLTMGQGLSKSGNTIAANFNLAQSSAINANLSKGFSVGGTRSGSVGSSSYATLTVAALNNALGSATLTLENNGYTLLGGETAGTQVPLLMRGVNNNNTITGLTDGWSHAGGATPRTLTVIAGNITLNGGGFGLTLSSNAVLSLNSNTLTIAQGSSNITFQSGSASGQTAATAHYLVQNSQAQYQLSTNASTFALGDVYYGSGAAFTSLARLPIGNGTSVLVSNGTTPIWSSITLSNSNAVNGILTVTNGGTGANTFTANGILYGNTTSAIQVTGAGTGNSVLVASAGGVPVWGAVILSSSSAVNGLLGLTNGGTAANLTAVNGGAVYSTSTALAITPAGTGGSILMSTGAGAPEWRPISLTNTNSIAGVLPIANGGSNSTSANFTSNGVVIYDSGNTRLASASGATLVGGTGLTITGTVATSGGFFISGNSVVSSLTPAGGSAIYGGVGISVLNTNPAGALSIVGLGQTISIIGPATGITGTGAANQVSYYSATRELTGNVGLVYNPTAATGVGLSVNVNAASGTILQVNTAQAMTSGLLVDIDNNGSQRYSLDWKGMETISVGSGNTGLIVSGGRTILSAATANYSTVNLPSSSGTNPGSGNTAIGDLWFNGTNLYFRKDATTSFDLLVGSVSGSGLADRVAKWSSGSGLTYSNLSESTAGVGMTLTSLGSIGAGGGTTALLTLQTFSATDDSKIDRYFVRGVTSLGTRLFSVDTSGNLRATTKSFDIPHPTKEGSRLVYGVLEGPEHGVYHRGTVEGNGVIQINLPDYWHKLVGDQYTIQLTPWGNYNVCINSKTENYFTIQLVGDFISRKFKNIKVDYIVHGSRLDAPLETEQ